MMIKSKTEIAIEALEKIVEDSSIIECSSLQDWKRKVQIIATNALKEMKND